MLFFLLNVFIGSIDTPLLNFGKGEHWNHYFDTWAYKYNNCSEPFKINGWQCTCPKYFNESNSSCVEGPPDNSYSTLNDYIIITKQNFETKKAQAEKDYSGKNFKYFDILKNPNGETIQKSQNNDSLYERIINSSIACDIDKLNQTACNFLSNMCTVSHFDQSFSACQALQKIFPNTIGGLHGYYDWPPDKPFLEFIDSLTTVKKESYVKSSFKTGDLITFQLAVYSMDGNFKEFKALRADFQKCGIKHNQLQIWRQFGWNYYSECQINLSFAFDTTDFYDIFFQESSLGVDTIANESYPILRPIPILLKNYRKGNSSPNRGTNEDQYRLFRRFFLFDNYTDGEKDIIQLLTNVTIVFPIRDSDRSSMQTPYLELEYTQISRNSDFKPGFAFNVKYFTEMKNFYSALLYVFVVLAILAVAYWVIHSFLYLKQYNYGGTDLLMVGNVFADFFLYTGTLFFVICLICSLYLLFFYKWAKNASIYLPPESDFNLFNIANWVSFGLLTAGIILKVLVQSSLNFFLIDWERPPQNNVTVSAWRRILVGNEWCKIVTVRAYSLSLTLCLVLFIVKGFDTILTASPVPTSELIDVGSTYRILRVGYISFIYLLIILVQYIIVNFVYWRFAGNPYLNFLEVCRTAKISCFLLSSCNHGYYLHGKKNDLPADVGIESLNEGIDLIDEVDEMMPNKVYEIYLASELYYYNRDQFNLLKRTPNNRGSRPDFISYNTVNRFLRDFIEQKGQSFPYVFMEWHITQMIDMGPNVVDESIFTKAPDQQFKYAMMYGIQGFLMLFYLVLITIIDITLYNPEIGCFIALFVDWIFYYIFKFRARYSLSSKRMLDKRLLIR